MSTDSPNPAAPTFPDPARSAAASLPDWVPPGSELDPKFACRVMAGVAPNSAPLIQPPPAKRPKLSLDEYTRGVLAADTDLDRHSLALLVAIQGGLVISRATHDDAALEVGLDTALRQLHVAADADRP